MDKTTLIFYRVSYLNYVVNIRSLYSHSLGHKLCLMITFVPNTVISNFCNTHTVFFLDCAWNFFLPGITTLQFHLARHRSCSEGDHRKDIFALNFLRIFLSVNGSWLPWRYRLLHDDYSSS